MKIVKFEKAIVKGVEVWRSTCSDGTRRYGQRIRSQFGHYLPNTVKNPDFKRRIDIAITAQGIRAARQEQKQHG